MSGLLVLGALLALLVAAWAVAFGAGATELDRADARLASEVHAASAGFSGLVGTADARAGSLAASPALQRAVLRRDRAAVRGLMRGRPDLAVYSGTTLLAGRVPAASVTRSVRVVARSRSIGRVVAVIPVDSTLLERLGSAADIASPDRLWVRIGSEARDAPVGKAFDLVKDRKYRVFAARLVATPQPVVLQAATPRAAIGQGARRRTLWLLLATLVSLGTLAVAIRGLHLLTGGLGADRVAETSGRWSPCSETRWPTPTSPTDSCRSFCTPRWKRQEQSPASRSGEVRKLRASAASSGHSTRSCCAQSVSAMSLR